MPKSGMTKADFAKVMGVDRAQPTRWAARGMPVLSDGTVHAVTCAEWVRSNVENYKVRGSVGAGQLANAERERWKKDLIIAYYIGDESAALIAAELLLPHLPEATVRSVVAELLVKLRAGSVDCLGEDVMPPPGCKTWADDPRFSDPHPDEHEWAEMLAKRTPAATMAGR